VIEAGRVGGGVRGNNTAKVAAVQSAVYSSVRRAHGGRSAADYAAREMWPRWSGSALERYGVAHRGRRGSGQERRFFVYHTVRSICWGGFLMCMTPGVVQAACG
jgi:hypothetical protein